MLIIQMYLGINAVSERLAQLTQDDFMVMGVPKSERFGFRVPPGCASAAAISSNFTAACMDWENSCAHLSPAFVALGKKMRFSQMVRSTEIGVEVIVVPQIAEDWRLKFGKIPVSINCPILDVGRIYSRSGVCGFAEARILGPPKRTDSAPALPILFVVPGFARGRKLVVWAIELDVGQTVKQIFRRSIQLINRSAMHKCNVIGFHE